MDTSEEKYPLLLLYAEDGSKSSDCQKRFCENKRGKHIIQGASTIITQWPAHVTTCWITGLCFGLLLILTTMILTYSLENRVAYYHRHPRCMANLPEIFSKQTIHIVHDNDKWTQQELSTLQYIIDIYKDYNIHIAIFKREINIDTNLVTRSINISSNETLIKTTLQSIQPNVTQKPNITDLELFYDGPFHTFNALKFIESLKNLKASRRTIRSTEEKKKTIITFDSIIQNKTNIRVSIYFYNLYFQGTPLEYQWNDLNKDLLLFVCRLQELWLYGGLSFYLPDENFDFENGTVTLKSLILTSRSVFEKLSTSLVSVDKRSYHMASKVHCHPFFGEIIAKIATASSTWEVQTLIEKTLRDFCNAGAVYKEDCKFI